MDVQVFLRIQMIGLSGDLDGFSEELDICVFRDTKMQHTLPRGEFFRVL